MESAPSIVLFSATDPWEPPVTRTIGSFGSKPKSVFAFVRAAPQFTFAEIKTD